MTNKDGIALIADCIQHHRLPADASELFGNILRDDGQHFNVQEGFLLDFKETIPGALAAGYGAGIVRLSLALFNTYGGIIVFGVEDSHFRIIGCKDSFDIEAFNRFLYEISGKKIECLSKSYILRSTGLKIEVVLVPRREFEPPAVLVRKLDKYPPTTLWVRDQHEVLEASSQHLNVLFAKRDNYCAAEYGRPSGPVHRSLPPSPATLRDFIGRRDLMLSLWNWLMFSDQPRLYLHGPGGSGKSTMAFEFAKTLADEAGAIGFVNGGSLDYVIYLSGKETELNPITGKQQPYQLKDFHDATGQKLQILFHSGILSLSEMEECLPDDIPKHLNELFSNYFGLIVIDDIDALSRRNIDTGEESLFLNLVRARSRTKILYTLRYVPPYALPSSIQVPGLSLENETPTFVDACCSQFGAPHPTPAEQQNIYDKTNGLPLLIETIIGLRRSSGNYRHALEVFGEKGGDEARRYLYQREYDRLDENGRARELLCALLLIGSKMTFSLLAGILSFPKDVLRDAVSEASSIFLTSSENDQGETSYQLSPPCASLVRALSPGLKFYAAIQRSVDLFKERKSKLSLVEVAVLSRMNQLIRLKEYQQMVDDSILIPPDDPIRVNPEFQSLMGQAFSRIGSDHFTQARECFNSAKNKGYWDIFMVRQWYYVEMHSGYSLVEAQRICEFTIAMSDISPRHKSEFYSKLGACFLEQSKPHRFTDRPRAIDFSKKSLHAYFESAWVGRNIPDIDRNLGKKWLEDSAIYFVRLIDEELTHLFSFIESLGDARHDIEMDAARTLVDPLFALSGNPRPAIRNRLHGLCDRTINSLKRSTRNTPDMPGVDYTIKKLQELGLACSS